MEKSFFYLQGFISESKMGDIFTWPKLVMIECDILYSEFYKSMRLHRKIEFFDKSDSLIDMVELIKSIEVFKGHETIEEIDLPSVEAIKYTDFPAGYKSREFRVEFGKHFREQIYKDNKFLVKVDSHYNLDWLNYTSSIPEDVKSSNFRYVSSVLMINDCINLVKQEADNVFFRVNDKEYCVSDDEFELLFNSKVTNYEFSKDYLVDSKCVMTSFDKCNSIQSMVKSFDDSYSELRLRYLFSHGLQPVN